MNIKIIDDVDYEFDIDDVEQVVVVSKHGRFAFNADEMKNIRLEREEGQD